MFCLTRAPPTPASARWALQIDVPFCTPVFRTLQQTQEITKQAFVVVQGGSNTGAALPPPPPSLELKKKAQAKAAAAKMKKSETPAPV